jgi:uncharacterized protein YjcR
MDMQKQESWIQFAKDWNAGSPVKALARKYGCEVSTVRNWVAMLRKKGVKLKSRQKAVYQIDAKLINRAL